MTQNEKDLLLKDLCARLPYGVKGEKYTIRMDGEFVPLIDVEIIIAEDIITLNGCPGYTIKPYLFPLSSMTDEDYAIYSKIWEDTGKTAYLEGCHHLISTIKAYKAANDYLISKHYDINGLIPMGLANDATDKNIY